MPKKLPAKTASAMDKATAQDIVPRLRTNAWLAAIKKQVPAEQLPVIETWQGDVLVTYALDLPEQFALVNARILERLGVAAEGLRELAIDNMRTRLGQVGVRDLDVFYAVEVENDLEACVILLDNFWPQVQEQMIQDEIVAAIPCRNGLLFCGASSTDGLAAMRAFVDTTLESHQQGDPNYLLSEKLYRRREGAWTLA